MLHRQLRFDFCAVHTPDPAASWISSLQRNEWGPFRGLQRDRSVRCSVGSGEPFSSKERTGFLEPCRPCSWLGRGRSAPEGPAGAPLGPGVALGAHGGRPQEKRLRPPSLRLIGLRRLSGSLRAPESRAACVSRNAISDELENADFYEAF